MVQVLERPESFGTRVARGLGAGLGTGFSKGLEQASKLAGKKAKASRKTLDRLYSVADPYLKQHGATYLHDQKKYHDLIAKAHSKYGDQDIHEKQMLELAMQDDDRARLDAKDAQADTRVAMQDSSNPMNFINKFLQRGKIPARDQYDEPTPSEERDKKFLEKEQQYPKSIAGLLKGGLTRPEEGKELSTAQTLGSMLAGGVKPFEDLMSMGRSGLTGEPGVGTQLSEALQKDLTPEQKEKAELYEDVGLLAPIEKLAKPAALAGTGLAAILGRSKFKPFWRAAKKIAKREGIKVEKAAENLTKAAEKEGISLEKILAGEKAEAKKLNEVAQDIGTPARKRATEMRMSRLAPESKLYKKGEQQKILQSQLKAHPRYAAEIGADAEQRAARLNKTLGPRALATREAKMATAQAELPAAKEAYQSAIARVRALEEGTSKFPDAMKTKIQPVIDAAVKELKESEFFLAQILNNAKSGESRVGLPQMRDAARKKMDKIADLIADGKEVKHTKMDYSPDMIKEGKRISTKKPVPGQTHDDFYTRVHDEYSGEYAKRIGKLKDEIKGESKGFSGLHQNMQRQKEINELQKMVDSAQAENTIHRHKLKLRQMDQRKLARERLGKTTKEVGPTKSREVAKEILSGKKSPKAAAEEISEEAAKKNPKNAEKIAEEAPHLEEVFEEVKKAEEELGTGAKREKKATGKEETQGTKESKKAKDAKDAKNKKEKAKKTISVMRKLQKKVDALLSKVPILGKYPAARDVMGGLIQGLIMETLTSHNLAMAGASSTISGVLGGRGEGRGTLRSISHFGTRLIIGKIKKEYKIHDVVKAHKSDDRHKVSELRQKYSPAIMKEGAKRANPDRR